MRTERLAVVGSVLAVVAIAGTAAGVRGVAERGRSVAPPAPASLTVSCGPAGITVSASRVAAGPAGVTFLVSTSMPIGTTLTFRTSSYGAGEELPSVPATWTRPVPPGDVRLTCSTGQPARPDQSTAVTVEDPDGQWRDNTVGDARCALTGAQPSWAISGSTGATAAAAVDGLLTQMGARNGQHYQAHDADLGYPEAATQTWVALKPDGTGFTIQVTRTATDFEAVPDRICG